MAITKKRFKELRRILGRHVSERGGKDGLAARARMAARIAELAEDGQVAIVSGGRDCDGCQWSGRVTIVPAIAVAVVKWCEDQDRWSDGVWSYALERVSVAQGVEESSRDLALEAFEDGHPHVLYG